MGNLVGFLYFLLIAGLGYCQSVPQYSINAGGDGIADLGWTASDSTKGMTVRTPSGLIYKYKYDEQVTLTPNGEKYTPYLYQTMLWTPDDHMKFTFDVVDKTAYNVKLHYVDFSKTGKNQREFQVVIDGVVVEQKFDIYETVKARAKPLVKSYPILTDGSTLTIQLNRIKSNPIINAIEIIPQSRLPQPSSQPAPLPSAKLKFSSSTVDFGEVGLGANQEMTVNITSDNPQTITAVQFIDKELILGFEFKYQLGLQEVQSGGLDLKFNTPVRVSSIPVPLKIWFSPTSPALYDLGIVFYGGKLKLGQLKVTGTGDDSNVKEGHTLHPIIAPVTPIYIDWDGDGKQTIDFTSKPSHTHSPDRSLVPENFEWFDEQDNKVATGPTWKASKKIGNHVVVLLIQDTAGDAAAEFTRYSVASPTKVPGAWKAYYAGVDSFEGADSSKPSFATLGSSVSASSAGVNANLELPYVIQVTASKYFKEPTKLSAINTKDMQHEILVDGAAYSGSELTGQKTIRFGVIVEDESALSPEPYVQMAFGSTKKKLSWVTHDQTKVSPVILEIVPYMSSSEGGQDVTLRGIGFDQGTSTVTVGGKAVTVQKSGFDLQGAFLQFISPANKAGAVDVVINTKDKRTSNAVKLQYQDVATFAPVKFTNFNNPIAGSASAVTFCFNYVFIAEGSKSNKGGSFTINQYTINDDYELTFVQELGGVSGGVTQNGENMDTILGLACDPWGTDEDFAIFASIGKIYVNGGLGPTKFLPYTGAVLFLKSSENFKTAHVAISNLPVSDHDHSVNGVVFLNDGQLLITIGGDTNAGIPNTKLGGLMDGPLSGAVLTANVKAGDFDGNLQYEFIPGQTGMPGDDPMDARNRGFVQVASGDVSVYAPGLRNAFGITICAHDLSVWATDNGPNKNFGGRMFGPPQANGELTLKTPGDINGESDPANMPDELVKVEPGKYYGHCNAARARAGADEQWYCFLSDESDPTVTGPVQILESSSDGIACYRAEAFNGGAKGDLFIQAYTPEWQYRIVQQDGEFDALIGGPAEDSNRELTIGLSIAEGPGGTLLVGMHNCNDDCQLVVNVPNDSSVQAGSMKLYQIDPWRAPATPMGPTTFTIYGFNFPAGATCTVTFGTTSVDGQVKSSKRVTGLLPKLTAQEKPYDVTVDCAGMVGMLTGHYYALGAFPVGAIEVA